MANWQCQWRTLTPTVLHESATPMANPYTYHYSVHAVRTRCRTADIACTCMPVQGTCTHDNTCSVCMCMWCACGVHVACAFCMSCSCSCMLLCMCMMHKHKHMYKGRTSACTPAFTRTCPQSTMSCCAVRAHIASPRKKRTT